MSRDLEKAKVHCPGCGAEAAVTQKFCRACGFNLEKVPQLVAEQLSESGTILTSEAEERLQKRQRIIERSLSASGLGLAAIVALSFLVGLIYLLATGSMPIVPGVVLLILLVGGIVAGSLGIYSERLKKELSNRASQKPLLSGKEVSSPPLNIHDGPLASVTERTTNLLKPNDHVETARRTRKEGDT